MFFTPGQVDTTQAATFTVSVAAAGVTDAAGAPMQIQFDPKVLRLNDITLGDLLTQGGQQPLFTKNIQNDAGTASVQLGRPAGGVAGGGNLVNLVFQAVGRGVTNVTVPNLTVLNSQGQPAVSGSPQVTVNVK